MNHWQRSVRRQQRLRALSARQDFARFVFFMVITTTLVVTIALVKT